MVRVPSSDGGGVALALAIGMLLLTVSEVVSLAVRSIRRDSAFEGFELRRGGFGKSLMDMDLPVRASIVLVKSFGRCEVGGLWKVPALVVAI